MSQYRRNYLSLLQLHRNLKFFTICITVYILPLNNPACVTIKQEYTHCMHHYGMVFSFKSPCIFYSFIWMNYLCFFSLWTLRQPIWHPQTQMERQTPMWWWKLASSKWTAKSATFPNNWTQCLESKCSLFTKWMGETTAFCMVAVRMEKLHFSLRLCLYF